MSLFVVVNLKNQNSGDINPDTIHNEIFGNNEIVKIKNIKVNTPVAETTDQNLNVKVAIEYTKESVTELLELIKSISDKNEHVVFKIVYYNLWQDGEVKDTSYITFTVRLNSIIDVDIEYLMWILEYKNDPETLDIAKYALSVLDNEYSFAKFKYYLYHGTQKQRDFVAELFKERKELTLYNEAIEKNFIDPTKFFK